MATRRKWIMTDDAKKLAEDNIRLAYFVAKQFNNLQMDPEDINAVALLGLVKAASKYKTGGNIKFSTFATIVMQNEILMAWRKERRHAGLTSLDAPVAEGGSPLGDLVPEKKDAFEELEASLEYGNIMDCAAQVLGGREREAFFLVTKAPGRPQREYAEEMGISQPYFSKLIRKARGKIQGGYKRDKNSYGVSDFGGGAGKFLGNCKERAAITAADIKKIRDKTKIGDVIRIHTLKACSIESSTETRTVVERRGTVVAKYPLFALVQLPSGIMEAVNWIDLLKKKKRG